jgi:hypothetical protein
VEAVTGAEAAAPRQNAPSRASDRILQQLGRKESRFRAGPALLFAVAGVVLGALVMYLARSGGERRATAGKSPGASAAVMAVDAGAKARIPAPTPAADAAAAKRPPPRPVVARPAPPPDAAVVTAMQPLVEPMAPPSMGSLIKRCKQSRYQPRLMLGEAQKILASKTHNVDLLERARRILHVLLQGGCVKPFTKLQRQTAYFLAQLYIHKGACYSAKNVWRMYAQRYKREFPHRKRPPFPPCVLRRE